MIFEADTQAFAQDLGGPAQRMKRDAGIVRIQEAVELRATRFYATHQLGLVATVEVRHQFRAIWVTVCELGRPLAASGSVRTDSGCRQP